MELEKSENTVARLYALRGGLSALSVKYDQTRRIDDSYHEKLHKVADTAGGARYEAPQGTIEYAEWLAGYGFENVLKNRFNSINKHSRSAEIHDCECEININNAQKKKHFTIATFLFLLFAAVVTVICLLIFKFKAFSDIKGTFAIIGNSIIGILVFGPCLGFPLAFSIMNFSSGATKKYAVKANKKQLKDLYKQDKIEDNRVANARKTAQANLDKLPQVRNSARKMLGERNGVIKPLVAYCNEYYKALLQEFSPLLDERDWQHLDLVIYELETRRADSVKEALQLVDRELQTERIERTIGEATKAICYTVARGFTELQSTVKICCDRICDRLDTISSQLDTVSMQMAFQSMQLAGISGQLADLTDSVNVGNALQAKANVTSAQLCSDVHAIRYYG